MTELLTCPLCGSRVTYTERNTDDDDALRYECTNLDCVYSLSACYAIPDDDEAHRIILAAHERICRAMKLQAIDDVTGGVLFCDSGGVEAMTIEWKDDGDTGNFPPGSSATVGDLELSAYSCRGWDYYRACVQIETEEDSLTLAHDKVPTLDAAKLAALDFAREWVARQAAALSPGQWTSAIPDVDGWYWIRTTTTDAPPEAWTPRVEYIDSRNRTLFWGEFFQCWSVPVAMPEVK